IERRLVAVLEVALKPAGGDAGMPARLLAGDQDRQFERLDEADPPDLVRGVTGKHQRPTSVRSGSPDKVLAPQLELCLPRPVSSPAPGGSIDGLRAFSRNPGRRASPATLLLSGGRVEGTGCVAAPGVRLAAPARGHSRKLRQVPVDNKVHRVRRLYGGWTLSDKSVRTYVGNSDQPVDEAVLGRLR